MEETTRESTCGLNQIICLLLAKLLIKFFIKLDTLKESRILTRLGRELNSLDFINRLMPKLRILRCSNSEKKKKDQKWGVGIKVLQASLVDIFEKDTLLHFFVP